MRGDRPSRLAAQRLCLDRAPFVVSQAWFVVREEDLADQVTSAVDAGFVEDAL
jgi:hypothetical protein